MNHYVHAPAAVIAAGLAGRRGWLTSSECVALATAAGYPRSDGRAGLEWAVSVGLIRRHEGSRTTRLHQLASSPQAAGKAGELAEIGVCGA